MPSNVQRISLFLDGNLGEYNAKTIANHTGVNLATTRVSLRRLLQQGKVRQPQRGFYSGHNAYGVMINKSEAELKLHGIKIETRVTPALAAQLSHETTRGNPLDTHRHRINHSITTTEEWDGRLLTLTVHPGGLVEVWLKATHDPLSFLDFYAFTHYINGRFKPITTSQWALRQADINWDVLGLQLDGISSLTLQVFQNLWLKMYQKYRHVVRVEARYTGTVSLSEALQVFSVFLGDLPFVVVNESKGGKQQ